MTPTAAREWHTFLIVNKACDPAIRFCRARDFDLTQCLADCTEWAWWEWLADEVIFACDRYQDKLWEFYLQPERVRNRAFTWRGAVRTANAYTVADVTVPPAVTRRLHQAVIESEFSGLPGLVRWLVPVIAASNELRMRRTLDAVTATALKQAAAEGDW